MIFFVQNDFQQKNCHDSHNLPHRLAASLFTQPLPHVIEQAPSQKDRKKHQRSVAADSVGVSKVQQKIHSQKLTQEGPDLRCL